MSATEIMEQVKALPENERRKFVKLFQEHTQHTSAVEHAATPVRWPDIEARHRAILGSRTLENMVLAERREERW